MDNSEYTDIELAVMDRAGFKLDWTRFDYDFNCREWAK